MRICFAAIACAVFACNTASAELLTFDALTGNTFSPTVTESGFTFTQTPNSSGTHYGDGIPSSSQMLDWHNNGSNANAVDVVLTEDNATNFDFLSFTIEGFTDYNNTGAVPALVVSAAGYGSQTFTTTGLHVLNWLDVSSVTFDIDPDYTGSGSPYIGVGIDNVSLNSVPTAPVPEPTSFAIWGLGLSCVAWRRRRRRS